MRKISNILLKIQTKKELSDRLIANKDNLEPFLKYLLDNDTNLAVVEERMKKFASPFQIIQEH